MIDTPALDRFLTSHRKTCTFWIYSGDRHCSCGLEDARAELEQVKAEQLQQLQLALDAQKERRNEND